MSSEKQSFQAELKDFDKAAAKIRKEAAKIRKDGVGLLTPSLLRKHLKSGQDLVLAYGRGGHTITYSAADLKCFAADIEKANKKLAGHVRGVPLLALEQASLPADKARAKDVSAATLYKVAGNLLYFRVTGKAKPHYQVRIRLEEWNRAISSAYSSNQNAARAAATGRLSIDCECGRHQYWYRYLSNIGGFDVNPPKEQDFPKIRNRQLTGCCCKHVLKVLALLKSPTIHRTLAKELERQSQSVGFADNVKARFLSSADIRSASLARGVARTPKEARAAFKRFQREAAEFIEAAKGRKEVQNKKSTLTPRPAPKLKALKNELVRPKISEALRSEIIFAAQVAIDTGISRKGMIDSIANRKNISREHIDAILKEEDL